MPTLDIGGKKITVDDSFLKLSPDEQNSAVDEIAGSLNVKPAAQAATTITLADVAKSAGTGVVKGAIGLAGLPGDAKEFVGKAVQAAGHYLGLPDRAPNAPKPSTFLDQPTSAQVQGAVESVAGKLPEPTTTAGKYAQSVGEMAPAILGGPGGLLRKSIQAVGSGVASEGAGEATAGTKAEPFARVAGAMLGGAAPSAVSHVVSPIAMSPARQRLVDILNQEGVTSLTAGQRTGSKTLQYAESILGDAPGAGGAASAVQREGQQQFTEAAMRRAGAGPNAAPEVLADNSARLARQFEDLSARNNVTFDPQFTTDMGQAVRNYERVPPSQQRAIVENYVNDISDHMHTGQMPGPQYQEMRSRLSRQSNSLRQSDPTLSEALGGLRNALDNNMARSIGPADREAWQTVRREYGAQKVLEKSASRAGEATAEGQIVPANLRNTVAVQNRGAYARGQGDFSELARAGSGVMAPLPNSGTGQRTAINTIATILGGGAGGAMTGGIGAMAGAAAGAAAPAAIGRILMSRPVQAYLGNQAMAAPALRHMSHERLASVVNAVLESQRRALPQPRN